MPGSRLVVIFNVPMIYLFGRRNLEEDVSHSYCLDQCHNKANVIPNAEEYSCYLYIHQ